MAFYLCKERGLEPLCALSLFAYQQALQEESCNTGAEYKAVD